VNWKKYYQRWVDRAGSSGKLDPGVTFVPEKWEIPGEEPLIVRLCTREGHPMSSFARMQDTAKHSITLHHTSGYGGFGSLMGDRAGGAHFMVGRDGNAYRLVDTEKIAWHANAWSINSIGIEVDNIGQLKLKGDTFYDEYGGAYCTKADEGVWVEKSWPNYGKYWATWSDEQYQGVGRLLKALCARHGIPRMILPEDRRYKGFDEQQQKKFRGICVHVNVKPDNRDDLGPYLDWAKIIRFGGLNEGDCFGLGPPGPEPERPPKKSSAPSAPKKSPPPPQKKKDAAPSTTATQVLAAPEIVDAHTVRVSVGARPGRISLTVKAAGEELKPAPAGKAPEAPKDAEGKRDKFVAAALSYKGTHYLAGSDDPKKGGLDAAGLIALCLKKVDVKLEHDPDKPLDGPALAAHFPPVGGDADKPPEGILPGDIAWFGEGDHDHPATQHPMIWLGGGKVLGPQPGTKSAFHGAVDVITIAGAGEKFAGFSHIEDLGEKVAAGEPHYADDPSSGHSVTAALLPSDPDSLYASLQGVVKDAGGKWESAAGKVNLVGVTDLVDRCQTSPVPGGWNDTLFAAWVDDEGHKHVIDARASLNPGHDADPAGSWHLLDGAYTFKLDKDALVPDGKVRGWHDEKGAGAPRPAEAPPPSEGDVLVSPMLRGIAQYDYRWNAPKPETTTTPVRGNEHASWQNNACHPTSISMVLRWSAEDNPATKDKFAFPTKEGGTIDPLHYPRRMAEAFFPNLGGKVPDDGSINHAKLRAAAEKALGMPENSALISLKGKKLDERLLVLRGALAKGPVVLLMPGHYIVLQGIVGDDLYIVDPGNVLKGNKFTYEDGTPLEYGVTMPKKKGQAAVRNPWMPPEDAWPNGKAPKGSSDSRYEMYVKVPIHKKVKCEKEGHHKHGPALFVEILDEGRGGTLAVESYWYAGGS
jgi:cell wall-associated NlpC family hydrolase